MANAMFDPGREGFLDGTIDWDTDDIRFALVRAYTFSAAHKFISDITTASGVLHARTAAGVGTKTVTSGVAGSAAAAFGTVTANASNHGLLIFKHTGADATARAIAYYDTGTGFPIVPGGGDITVSQDAGANKWFKL